MFHARLNSVVVCLSLVLLAGVGCTSTKAAESADVASLQAATAVELQAQRAVEGAVGARAAEAQAAARGAAQDNAADMVGVAYIEAVEVLPTPESLAERFAAEPFLMLEERENRGPRDLVIVAVGDVSQPTHQWVERTNETGEAAFDPTRHLLDTGELVFMNLENPMTTVPPVVKKTYVFNSPPERLEWYMKAGFNMYSLANNHIADCGEEGIVDTVRNIEAYAEKLNMPVWHAGVGDGPDGALAPVYIRLEGKDVTVAFISVGFSRSPNVGRFWDERIPGRIAEARENADIVFISTHAGKEYQHTPNADMQARYRSWIDAGADLVVGHHPHSIQPVERYKQGLIFYSLGNYVFASRTRRHREMNARLYGLLTRIVIHDGKVHGAELVPTWVNNSEDWRLEDGQVMPNANFIPQVLTGAFADQFFEDFENWTRESGATQLERVGDVGLIKVVPEEGPTS